MALMRHLFRALKRSLHARLFRLRFGFDYRDCWNLDKALAKWLAPRLNWRAQHSSGSPAGYPGGNETDHEAWVADLTKAAAALTAYQRWDFPTFEEEIRTFKEARAAMLWVADHFDTLWD